MSDVKTKKRYPWEEIDKLKQYELFQDIANKVVIQAIRDYRLALKGDYKFLKIDCEMFFRSEWFKCLCNFSTGDELMALVEETWPKKGNT